MEPVEEELYVSEFDEADEVLAEDDQIGRASCRERV